MTVLPQVLIASAKNAPVKMDYTEESTRTRLFVVCPKDSSEEDLKRKFEHFGDLEYCSIVRDRQTGENKGFGYVKFTKASTAALAMENCDKSLKAILAEPKAAKFAREAALGGVVNSNGHMPPPRDPFAVPPVADGPNISPTPSLQDLPYTINSLDAPEGVRLFVIVSSSVTQEQLARLFDLVPGMEMCDLKINPITGESKGYAFVTFSSLQAAVYAKEKLNGFEYPPGQQLIVKYAEDPLPAPRIGPPSPTAEPVFAAHQYASAPISPLRSPIRSLSPMRPMPTNQRRHSFSSDFDSRVFFICNPHPPAEHILREVFGRFGVLTDVWLVRGKNYGYAKFTTRSAAEAAITALHGMEVFGVLLKVMLADPPPEAQQKGHS